MGSITILLFKILKSPAFLAFIFIIFDLVSGGISAMYTGTWSSSIMRKGLFHKAGEILMIALGFLVDYAQMIVDLGVKAPVAAAVCVYIIIMETGSIAENIARMNPDLVPDTILKIIGMNKKGGDDNDVS